MWTYLDSLRSRPDEYKRRFAYTVSGVITGTIFCVWVWITFIHGAVPASQLNGANGQGASAQDGATSSWEELRRATEQIKKTLNDGMGTIESNFSDLKAIDEQKAK